MITLDCETCGFYGMPVLLQYAVDQGEIILYEIWKHPIRDTLRLFKNIAHHKGGVLGFNLAFDWFHINKCYNVFRLCDPDWIPEQHIEEIACLEKQARDGVCLKPYTACDLFLWARKGEYQSTLDRSDIRIRRVPKALAIHLANELNNRLKFNALYFSRRKTKLANPWQVFDIKDGDKDVSPDFKDIVLKFAPSSGLKALSVDALGVDESDLLKFGDVSVSNKLNPEECGWAPYAEAIGEPGRWRRTWPDVIKWHIEHWSYHDRGREYARRDVDYTRRLHPVLGSPEMGDDDSILACAVACIRWKGYKVDLDALKVLKDKVIKTAKAAPKSPGRVRDWIWPDLDETERVGTGGSTKKVILEDMATWTDDCPSCHGAGCDKCEDGVVPHKAAVKAKAVLDARKAKKKIELYDKMLQAERFHASFKIIGALSGRMSGADQLNPQGIDHSKEVRSCFPLAWDGMQLIGGDFESFEVVIAVAIYKDQNLERDLDSMALCPECKGTGQAKGKTCKDCGGKGQTKKKVHGLFGETLYGKSYDEVAASKGSSVKDMYSEGKRGVFSQLYGGNEHTLVDRLGVALAIAEEAVKKWSNRYPGIKKAQHRIVNMFGSMAQPNGVGSKVEWREPARYIESLLGFRRYFDLENRVCKTLFDLAEKPPKAWTNLKLTVRRRDRDQTASGAVRSALFGAAFNIQSSNIRAATNHEIQATGAGITKNVQRRIWDLQPVGEADFVVMPMNIHDEIMVPCKPEYIDKVNDAVNAGVESYRHLVPRISIDWSNELKTWADK